VYKNEILKAFLQKFPLLSNIHVTSRDNVITYERKFVRGLHIITDMLIGPI